MENKKGLLVILSAPSGCGKDTLFKEICKTRNDCVESVSATTRAPREGEVEGVNYFFKTEDEFRKMIDNDGLLEYARYNNCYYGTPVDGVEKAIKEKKLVAGICNASVFLGMHGFLNEVKHTSNTLNYLKQYAGDKYTGDSNYINEQAVRDENIVTANGTGQLEFCKEILYALEADTADAIEESYLFYKNGFCPGA